MIQYERQQEILRILEIERALKVKDIAKRVFTSESSVRRDLEILEKGGYIHRVYGGAVLSEYMNSVVPLKLRDSQNSVKKDMIAKKATELIFDGAVIIMDSSSTVRRMCRFMKGFKNLKIITNNPIVFTELSGCDYTLYCTGGEYNEQNNVFTGVSAEEYLKTINADLLFFSSQAISEDGYITDISEKETSIRKIMLKQSAKKIFLCDSSKIGEKKMFNLCHKDDVDIIICDQKLPWE